MAEQATCMLKGQFIRPFGPRSLPHHPFLIHCTPSKRVHSLTVKGLSFSKFSIRSDADSTNSIIIATHPQKVSPYERINDAIAKALKSLQKPAIAAITVGLLLMCDPNSAIAASGGRMSYSRFSSSSKSSSKRSSSKRYSKSDTSSSTSSSVPRTSSKRKRYSKPKTFYGTSYTVPSTSSSRSYSEPETSSMTSYSVSDSEPYTSSMTSYLVPRWRRYSKADTSSGQDTTMPRTYSSSLKSYSEPDTSSWTSCSVSVSPKSSHDIGPGGGSKVYFIMAGLTMSTLVSMLILVSKLLSKDGVVDATGKTSVLKLQVGLLDKGRSLQKDLNHVAEVADSLSFVLTETLLALLRHPDRCISGYSCVVVKRNMEDCEIHFNQQCIEERGKFDEETLVNVNGIKKQLKMKRSASEFNNRYIVITILVAAEGVCKLPAINNSGDLKDALQKLGSIPTDKILAVEVLWTPQDENDTLTEQELLEDYPLLRPF